MIKNYMDNYTSEKPNDFSKKSIQVDFSFIDFKKKKYYENEFKIKAATRGSWNINILINENLEKGDGFFIYILNGMLAQKSQNKNERASNYISYRSKLDINIESTPPRLSNICRVYLNEDAKKGDTISISIDNASSYWTAGKSYVFVDYYNNKLKKPLPIVKMPKVFEVVNRDEIALIRILGPTVAKKNERQSIHIGVFDNCGNIIKNYNEDILFEGVKVKLKRGLLIINDYIFNEEKVYRLKAKLIEDDKVYYSNPIVCKTSPSKYIYWGDLHAHGWGDNSMHLMHVNNKKVSPENRHKQAKDIGRFDFCAVGPMAFPEVDRDDIWETYRNVCKKFNKENEYIPFLAYEAHPYTGGDRNIFFKDLNEKLPIPYRAPMYEVDDKYNKRDDVMVECHIGGRTPRFEDNLNYRERMVEVISAFGNAEWLLQKTLKYGYKPAVCGCSDLHYGLMGGPRAIEEGRGRFQRYFNKRDSAYGTGAITAVIAVRLSRNSLWESMEKRATYATNDDRAYIDFNINGSIMGEEIEISNSYKCNIEIYGTAIIKSISLVSGENIIEQFYPDSLDFKKEILIDSMISDFIYLRVIQENGGFLLTSPIYIKPKYKKWNYQGDMQIGKKSNQAKKYLTDVINYIKTEEDITKFRDITPIDIIEESITKCALFNGYFGNKQISIRWYFLYEEPRIRFDWGFTNIGNSDCEIIQNINNPD